MERNMLKVDDQKWKEENYARPTRTLYIKKSKGYTPKVAQKKPHLGPESNRRFCPTINYI